MRNPVTEDIEQGRLTRPGRAQDDKKLAWVGKAANTVQDILSV
jgi:hypothetical protein